MADPQPHYTRPWPTLGLGWLFAVAVLFLVGGSALHLWAFSATINQVCLALLALALVL